MGYSTKHSNTHFLRAMLSRSISNMNHTTARHGFSIPALCSLATGRWARGLHRNTNAYPLALERAADCGVDELLAHFMLGHVPQNISQAYITRLVLSAGPALRQAQRKVSKRILHLLGSDPTREGKHSEAKRAA
jgi:hypothetical protein